MSAMNLLINSVNGSEGEGDEDGDDFRVKGSCHRKIGVADHVAGVDLLDLESMGE
jgi:hypothetical protein